MGLNLVDTFTISSNVTSIIIGGGSSGSSTYNFAIDSSYNVYKLVINGLKVSADDAPFLKVTKSGTAQSDAKYDESKRYLKADAAYAIINQSGVTTGSDAMATVDSGNAAGGGHGVYYLFNFPNSSEYSYVSIEQVHLKAGDDTPYGFQGGFTHRVASASDGLLISANNHASGSELTAGTFTLYGLSK